MSVTGDQFDLGALAPGQIERLRRELLDAVTDEDWEQARRAGFGDPELVTE